MMKIAFRVTFIFKMATDKIGNISMFSNFNENWYLGLFWSEELIGNDENCIQGHFYDAIVSKMATNKIDKLLMVSDCNENWYLGVFEVRNSLVMMKFAFRVISTRPPFSKWLPTNRQIVNGLRFQWKFISRSILKWGIGWCPEFWYGGRLGTSVFASKHNQT
jgi:hypothetical protein